MGDFNAASDLRERLRAERDKFTNALLSRNTQKGYLYDWQRFLKFCARMNVPPLPASPDTVSFYAVEQLSLGLKVTTVTRHLAAIARMHRDEKFGVTIMSADIKALLQGARRLRIEQVRQVLPLTLEHLRSISTVLAAEDTALSLRNRAIVIVGFASALRTASLAALLLEDVDFSDKGLTLKIRKEKQDQEGKGRLVGIPHGKHRDTCPVKSLADWIARRGSFPGPLFTRMDWHEPQTRSLEPERIGQIVQQCIRRIGLDAKLYGGHSLRAGFCTSAGEAGAGELLIAAQTGHRDLATLRRYFRRQDVFRMNPVGLLDL